MLAARQTVCCSAAPAACMADAAIAHSVLHAHTPARGEKRGTGRTWVERSEQERHRIVMTGVAVKPECHWRWRHTRVARAAPDLSSVLWCGALLARAICIDESPLDSHHLFSLNSLPKLRQ